MVVLNRDLLSSSSLLSRVLRARARGAFWRGVRCVPPRCGSDSRDGWIAFRKERFYIFTEPNLYTHVLLSLQPSHSRPLTRTQSHIILQRGGGTRGCSSHCDPMAALGFENNGATRRTAVPRRYFAAAVQVVTCL